MVVRVSVGACVLAGSLLAGCASDAPPAAQAAPITRPIQRVPTGSTAAATATNGTPKASSAAPSPSTPALVEGRATPMDAGKLTVSAGHTFVYDTEDGRQMTVSQEALPDCHCAGRSWWVRYTRAGATEPEREVRLTIDTNGYIAQMEEIDRIDKVEVEYAPPLVVIPDKLPIQSSGDASFQQDVKMTVHPLGNRAKVRTSGTAHNTIRYAGDEHITTAAGEFVARKLQCTLIADLSAATTMNTTEQWWADGVGLVFEKDHEITRALGLKVRDNATTMMLRSYSDGAQRK